MRGNAGSVGSPTGGRRLDAGLAWWARGVMRWAPWVVLLGVLAAAAAFYYTLTNLGINTDTASMISNDLPFRQTYLEYKRAFPQHPDTLVLVIDGETPELAREAASALAARLRSDSARFRDVYQPGGGSFFERNGLLYQSPSELEALADNLARVQPFLAKLSADRSLRGLLGTLRVALDAVRDGEAVDLAPVLERVNITTAAALAQRHRPLSWETLLDGGAETPSRRRQFLLVQPELDYAQLFALEPAITTVRRFARELAIDASQGLRLRITGGIAMDHEELRTVSRGTGIAGGLALLLVTVTLLVGLRSVRLVAATMLTLVCGLIFTAAFATVAVGHLNLVSVAFAVLYIGLSVDFAIHLCMRYQEFVQADEDPSEALPRAVRAVGPSLMLCALTTAAGFYSFIPTAYAGVGELGLISGTGMFISLVVTLTLLPALLHLWPASRLDRWRGQAAGSPPAFLVVLPLRYSRAVRVTALGLALAALFTLPQARFDYDPLELRDPATESVATFRDLLADSESSPWTLTVLSPDLERVREYTARLQELNSVENAVNLESFVPAEQEDKLALIEELALIIGPRGGALGPGERPSRDAQLAAIGDTSRALQAHLDTGARDAIDAQVARLKANLDGVRDAAQSNPDLLDDLERALLATLPRTLDRLYTLLEADTIAAADLPPELEERWLSRDGVYRIEVYSKEDLDDEAALRRFVAEVRTVAPEATDQPVLMLESGNAIVATFRQAFVIALAVIAGLLLVELRSVRDSALVLVPLLFGAAVTGALLIVLRIPFNFANIIALPLLLGIGVDNGIHMIRRMRSAATKTELLHSSTTRAMLFSALTTILSFGNLSFSPHPGTASLGQLLTIGVLVMLVSTLVVLPTLLNFGSRRAPRATP